MGLELWCWGTCLHNAPIVCLRCSGCWRKKPGVLEDARVCWELVGESAKGMSLTRPCGGLQRGGTELVCSPGTACLYLITEIEELV